MRFTLSLSAEQCYNEADICHFRQHQYEYNRCLIFCIRVKEKQVRFLYEPVTVIGELEAMRICAVTGNRREGSLKRAEIPRTHKPGNLPVISAGMFVPRPRGFGCAITSRPGRLFHDGKVPERDGCLHSFESESCTAPHLFDGGVFQCEKCQPLRRNCQPTNNLFRRTQ